MNEYTKLLSRPITLQLLHERRSKGLCDHLYTAEHYQSHKRLQIQVMEMEESEEDETEDRNSECCSDSNIDSYPQLSVDAYTRLNNFYTSMEEKSETEVRQPASNESIAHSHLRDLIRTGAQATELKEEHSILNPTIKASLGECHLDSLVGYSSSDNIAQNLFDEMFQRDLGVLSCNLYVIWWRDHFAKKILDQLLERRCAWISALFRLKVDEVQGYGNSSMLQEVRKIYEDTGDKPQEALTKALEDIWAEKVYQEKCLLILIQAYEESMAKDGVASTRRKVPHMVVFPLASLVQGILGGLLGIGGVVIIQSVILKSGRVLLIVFSARTAMAAMDCIRIAIRGMGSSQKASMSINVGYASCFYLMYVELLYSGTKGGVVLFTRSIAPLKCEGIRINVLCLKLVQTKIAEQMNPKFLKTAGKIVLMEVVIKGAFELIEDESKAGAYLWITNSRGMEYWPTSSEEKKYSAKMSKPKINSTYSMHAKIETLYVFEKIIVYTLSHNFRPATKIVQAPLRLSIKQQHALVKVIYAGVNASDVNCSYGRYFSCNARNVVAWPPFDASFEAVGLIAAVSDSMNMKVDTSVTLRTVGSYVKVKGVLAKHLLPVPKPDISISNSLIDMYAKCGRIIHGKEVFDRMSNKDIVSWNTMIVGYGIHGLGQISLVSTMEAAGLEPDDITFIYIIYACSHSGLVAEGKHWVEAMSQTYGIRPRMEHYISRVDLLGRGGLLDEARKFINRMPSEPDARVGGALLGACRIHGNVKLGEEVSRMIQKLGPEGTGNYVLLSNVYSAAGRFDEAAQVRIIQRSNLEGLFQKHVEMAANVQSPKVSILRLISWNLISGCSTTIFLIFRSVFIVVLGFRSSKSLFSELLYSRSKLATIDENNAIVTSRRADRHFEEEGPIFCAALDGLKLSSFPEYEVRVRYVTEHRCEVVVKGPQPSGNTSGTDLLEDNRLLLKTEALEDTEEARYRVVVVNKPSKKISRILESHPLNAICAVQGKDVANVVLLRGCGIRIEVTSCKKQHGPFSFMVASTKFTAGLGMSLGIDILEAPGTIRDHWIQLTPKATTKSKVLPAPLQSGSSIFIPGEDEHKPGPADGYDFGFLHIKAIDERPMGIVVLCKTKIDDQSKVFDRGSGIESAYGI